MRFEEGIKLDFKDVLLRPKRSTLRSRAEVDLLRSFRFLHAERDWQGVPIIAANMDHTGTFAMAEALAQQDLLTALSKFATLQEWQAFHAAHAEATSRCWVSAGTAEEDLDTLHQVLDAGYAEMICLDVANGYSEHFVNFVRRTREDFPKAVIMAGNVVTGEMVEELILSGADIVKIGIGPGSVCTTREKTGVGYPQLSAIIECADAAHGLGGHVCADGGCVVPGDVVKAFAAGADFVMLGGMLAGHDECAGEKYQNAQGKECMRFYGMSSAEAMKKYKGKVAEYRASEGRSVNVPYRGAVTDTLQDILGGLRSACTYVGARRLKELSKRTTFVRVSQQLNESLSPHTVD
jgi:GMP reductase